MKANDTDTWSRWTRDDPKVGRAIAGLHNMIGRGVITAARRIEGHQPTVNHPVAVQQRFLMRCLELVHALGLESSVATDFVVQAREVGVTWAQIGDVLGGMSRQAAWERWKFTVNDESVKWADMSTPTAVLGGNREG